MAFLRKIQKLLLGDLSSAERLGLSYLPSLPSKFVALSMANYKLKRTKSSRDHKFNIRYAPYGANSMMECATVRAFLGPTDNSITDNALETNIELDNVIVASSVMVIEDAIKVSAENLFPQEVQRLRSGGKICELTHFKVDNDEHAVKALGALMHVNYLYSRQVRGLRYCLIQVPEDVVQHLEMLLGFERIATLGTVALMVWNLDDAKKLQRRWGGLKEEGKDCPFLLYPYFFKSKDEIGLIIRVIDYLGLNEYSKLKK